MNPRGRGLVENEEQGKNQKMKSIVVEEQEQEEEQEEGSESESETETGFVDLDRDTLRNVLERVDAVTLGQASCVNKLWHRVAREKRLYVPLVLGDWINSGNLEHIDQFRKLLSRSYIRRELRRVILPRVAEPPPSDFYSIDPHVFLSQIRPWR